ncbi:MAG: hypothetical protein AAB784_02885 [Patescibacteria group bacterium]
MNFTSKLTAIKTYLIEPPILDQCPNCTYAAIDKFEPMNCPEIHQVAMPIIICLQNHWIFAEGPCNSFQAGTPQKITSLPILGNT